MKIYLDEKIKYDEMGYVARMGRVRIHSFGESEGN
jgi:hypothetical protein